MGNGFGKVGMDHSIHHEEHWCKGPGIEIRHKRDLKELFEGDIIRVAKTDIVQIIKDEQTGNFTTEPPIKYCDWGWNETMCDHRDRVELIGNIFENEEKLYK